MSPCSVFLSTVGVLDLKKLKTPNLGHTMSQPKKSYIFKLYFNAVLLMVLYLHAVLYIQLEYDVSTTHVCSVISYLTSYPGQLFSCFVVYKSGYQRSWPWLFTKMADQIIMWTINGLFCFGSTVHFSSTHSRCSIAACLFLRR